jgi:hypothetical protein
MTFARCAASAEIRHVADAAREVTALASAKTSALRDSRLKMWHPLIV